MARDVQPDSLARTDREKSSLLEAPSISVSKQRAEHGYGSDVQWQTALIYIKGSSHLKRLNCLDNSVGRVEPSINEMRRGDKEILVEV
jgi:hypothetical protein